MIEETLAELVRVYETAVACLRADVATFIEHGTVPPVSRRAERVWCYPELRVTFAGRERGSIYSRSFGRLSEPGTYVTTVTRPALFRR